jgi:hypothetical protein
VRMYKLEGANGSAVYVNKDSVVCAEGVNQAYRDFLCDKYNAGLLPNNISKANSVLIVGSGTVYLATTLEDTLLALGVNP